MARLLRAALSLGLWPIGDECRAPSLAEAMVLFAFAFFLRPRLDEQADVGHLAVRSAVDGFLALAAIPIRQQGAHGSKHPTPSIRARARSEERTTHSHVGASSNLRGLHSCLHHHVDISKNRCRICAAC